MSPKDYYAALGIDRRESFPGIHKAYRQLAKACHPDRVGQEGTQRFQELQEAYEVLSDPGKRKTYDASMDRHRRVSSVRVGAHTVEPLVPSPQTSKRLRPEPLVSPYVGVTPHVVRCAGWTFCDSLGGVPRHLTQQEEIEKFIMRCLTAFRMDRKEHPF